MELDTDCEIIGTHPQSIKDNYPIITSDRQATVQARPPDKMATSMLTICTCNCIHVHVHVAVYMYM